MKDVISDTNLEFIHEAIEYLSGIFNLQHPKNILWVAFGSYVINMNKAGSDLDLMAIDGRFIESKRSSHVFLNVPIHFTMINNAMLKDDGEKRLYGAYFSGKIINPHIFLHGDETSKRQALFHSGKFISPLAGYLSTLTGSKMFSSSQVTALVFIAYLSTDPSFDSYFLNYYSSINFFNIWDSLCKSTIDMLMASDEIAAVQDQYVFKSKFDTYKDFHTERMKISARHWSYGAVCHNSDYKFQDEIYTKAEAKIRKIDPTGTIYNEMVGFLKRESGLNQIYI